MSYLSKFKRIQEEEEMEEEELEKQVETMRRSRINKRNEYSDKVRDAYRPRSRQATKPRSQEKNGEGGDSSEIDPAEDGTVCEAH